MLCYTGFVPKDPPQLPALSLTSLGTTYVAPRLRIVWLLIAILSMITPRFANTYLSAQEAAPAKVAAKDSAEKGESLADGAHIVNVQRIWDAAHHNAFTDLIRFHDQWYCVFREGSSHVSPTAPCESSARPTVKRGLRPR
ncbi:MAG: hypothetical protein R3C56_07005 [Pirellulaceae bacterium]